MAVWPREPLGRPLPPALESLAAVFWNNWSPGSTGGQERVGPAGPRPLQQARPLPAARIPGGWGWPGRQQCGFNLIVPKYCYNTHRVPSTHLQLISGKATEEMGSTPGQSARPHPGCQGLFAGGGASRQDSPAVTPYPTCHCHPEAVQDLVACGARVLSPGPLGIRGSHLLLREAGRPQTPPGASGDRGLDVPT